jgi:hypothetical protein
MVMKQIEVRPGVSLEEILQQAQGEDVVLTQNGHTIALVSAFDDTDLYWYAREHDPEFLASISRARDQAAQGQTVTHDELKQQLGIE